MYINFPHETYFLFRKINILHTQVFSNKKKRKTTVSWYIWGCFIQIRLEKYNILILFFLESKGKRKC